MKKLERQLHSTSITAESLAAVSETSRLPVVPRINGLAESIHHRISSSPVKSSLPRSSDSSTKILAENGMLARNMNILDTSWRPE